MKTAVVTGSARGIGRAIAARLGRSGFRLVLIDRSPGLAETVSDLERDGFSVDAMQLDLTDEGGLEKVASAVGPTVDVLVNNAGITRDARVVNMTDEDIREVLDVNLGAAHRLTQVLLGRLNNGSIVNVASRSYLGNFGQYNYSMSKGGLIGMTRALALQLAPSVRINAIAPGLIGTEMAMGIPEDIRDKMIARIPMARMGTAEEVAELTAFLTSDASSYITGQVIVLGGGRSLT